MLPGAGATLPERDAIGARLVREARAASGKLISHPDRVGGWLELALGTPPPDADHEGMADGWEMRSGLNPANPADRNGDFDADGYTNLEDYLNDLAGRHPAAGRTRVVTRPV